MIETDSRVAAVLDAIDRLRPELRERAGRTEQARRIPVETIAALRDTGFFALLQPRRYGGCEAHPVDFYAAVKRLASACGSTGWVASVLGVPPWNVGLFDVRAQDEVWGQDTATRICSSYGLTGAATPVDGGYRLTGRWAFASGCDHADWALLGARIEVDGTVADAATFLVPVADYTVVDVWDAVGLRGTGSNDITVTDAFVPAHRVLDAASVQTCVTPGQAVNDGPLYRVPFGAIHPSAITVPIIGMAEGAYQAHLDHQRVRTRVALPGEANKDNGFQGAAAGQDPFALTRIAEAATEIDAAWLQITYNIGELYDRAVAAEPLPMAIRLRAKRDQVRGTERAIYAVDRLFDNSGGRALGAHTAIQRFWRDAHAGRAHAANDTERAYVRFGAAELAAPAGERRS